MEGILKNAARRRQKREGLTAVLASHHVGNAGRRNWAQPTISGSDQVLGVERRPAALEWHDPQDTAEDSPRQDRRERPAFDNWPADAVP